MEEKRKSTETANPGVGGHVDPDLIIRLNLPAHEIFGMIRQMDDASARAKAEHWKNEGKH